jgi:metal-responsive CopG/Arc/MetJ family transcriptional regulator
MRKGVKTGKDRPVKRQQPTVPLSLRMPRDLLARVDAMAEVEDRSRSKVVEILVREGLERRQGRR